MSNEKYFELGKRRFKDFDEKPGGEGTGILKQNKALQVVDLSLESQESIETAEDKALRIITEKKRLKRYPGKYFYAVIEFNEERKFGEVGMNDEMVYTIPYRDIAAVVSDTNIMDYKLTEENIRRHETVLRKIMSEYSVVPTEFGTVIKNDRIMKRLLRGAYNAVKECLRLVDNMVELGVKAILKKDFMYFDEELGKLGSQDILLSLKKKAAQSVTGELFSDRLIINESFLVSKDEVDAFSEEVARIEARHPMLKLLYSGPWAPYNFVHIKIGKEAIEFRKKEVR